MGTLNNNVATLKYNIIHYISIRNKYNWYIGYFNNYCTKYIEFNYNITVKYWTNW